MIYATMCIHLTLCRYKNTLLGTYIAMYMWACFLLFDIFVVTHRSAQSTRTYRTQFDGALSLILESLYNQSCQSSLCAHVENVVLIL